MTSTTLYYFFSTVAQVLAATTALSAIFTQFKLSELKRYLIGDGQVVYIRMEKQEHGYILQKHHQKFLDRLRDANARQSIMGILEVIKMLSNQEMSEGKDQNTNPRGLQFLHEQFLKKVDLKKRLRRLTIKTVFLSFITIFLSLGFISITEQMISEFWLQISSIVLIFILAASSLLLTFRGIKLGIKENDEI